MDHSPRLSLPYIAPAQAQKHVTHNEALRQLDVAVQLVVEQVAASTPPALPQDGQTFALGASPQGAWAGQANQIALWTDNTWQFSAPGIGWRLWDRNTDDLRVWSGSAWNVVQGAIGSPDMLGINSTADVTNRLALSSTASLFNHNGAGHQLKVNKNTAGDTASLLFQTGFSGRAEMGTAGNDNFAIKVSDDGSAWNNAMVLMAANGRVGLGADNPDYNLHVRGGSAYAALEDSNGVLGGSMSAALRMFAGGTEHGQVGFPGTTSGTMYLRNLQGNLFLEADTRDLEAGSFIRLAVDGDEMIRVEASAVGIGTSTPARSLHVDDVMRLEPTSAPASPAAGDIYFDSATSKLRCHDGTQWNDLF